MAAHGGSLDVESSVGNGSVFYARLPLVKPSVLLVDNNPADRVLTAHYLKEADAAIIGAEDGEEALKKLKEKVVHLIVTDIMMPVKDGFELIKGVKEDPKNKSIPIIVITSDKRAETRERAFSAGADDFLEKPLQAESFIQRIKKIIM